MSEPNWRLYGADDEGDPDGGPNWKFYGAADDEATHGGHSRYDDPRTNFDPPIDPRINIDLGDLGPKLNQPPIDPRINIDLGDLGPNF